MFSLKSNSNYIQSNENTHINRVSTYIYYEFREYSLGKYLPRILNTQHLPITIIVKLLWFNNPKMLTTIV